MSATTAHELYAGAPLPHFNEVDECAGLDALVTNRVWTALGLDPETTLHDVRWGEEVTTVDRLDEFVWVLPDFRRRAALHICREATRERSASGSLPMYFRLGGGTLKGVCKPGAVVWSRVFVEGGST